MRLYKRGATYWFELEFEGVRYQRSTKVKNERVAQQILSAFHTALVKGEVGIVDRKPIPLFKKAMEDFLAFAKLEHRQHPSTARRLLISSKPLLRFFKSTPLNKITPADVEAFKKKRSTDTVKGTGRVLRPATVNRDLACLRVMFNHAAKANRELSNPVSDVNFLEEDNQQERVLTYAEQHLYLAAASQQLRDVAGLILETGMRPEEAIGLHARNVDLDGNFLRIMKSKTPAGKRRIELTPESRRILKRRMDANPGGFVFPHDRNPKTHAPRINSQHNAALAASGVRKFKPYDLRHTWATRAAEAGIDLVTLASMMGHSRIQMVMRYAHPTQVHQTSAMEKLTLHKAKQEAAERAKAEAETPTRTMFIVSKTA